MTFVRGVDAFVDFIKKVADKFPDKVSGALYRRCLPIMTEAKRRCPVAANGGALRASGKVHPPERKGKRISVTMSFGGPAIDYAEAVHEHLSSHSPPSWIAAEAGGMGVHWRAAGTGPKFLEGPINEAIPHLPKSIATDIKFEKGNY